MTTLDIKHLGLIYNKELFDIIGTDEYVLPESDVSYSVGLILGSTPQNVCKITIDVYVGGDNRYTWVITDVNSNNTSWLIGDLPNNTFTTPGQPVEIYESDNGKTIEFVVKSYNFWGELVSTQTYKSILKLSDVISKNEPTCTKEYLVNKILNYYKGPGSKYVIRWIDDKTPVVDVTKLCQSVNPSITSAELTIYLGNLPKIIVNGPYDTQPRSRSADEVYEGWKKGYEYQRQYCDKNKKWYWVIIPCKLNVKTTDSNKSQTQGCNVDYFVDYLINYYKGSGSKYVVKWIDNYTPVLDVTSWVRVVNPNVSSAYLYLYFGRKQNIVLYGPYKDKPETYTIKDTVSFWYQNEAPHLCYCDKNNCWYYVFVPCKLYTNVYSQGSGSTVPDNQRTPSQNEEPPVPLPYHPPNDSSEKPIGKKLKISYMVGGIRPIMYIIEDKNGSVVKYGLLKGTGTINVDINTDEKTLILLDKRKPGLLVKRVVISEDNPQVMLKGLLYTIVAKLE